MKESIFIAIASYLDPELPYTIIDCISKCSQPDKLHFGVCLQYDDAAETSKDILDYYCGIFNIKIDKYHFSESKGGCWARNKAQKFYSGETYSLQIDSHTRFIKNWDILIKKDYNDLLDRNFKKPLLTFLPPPYTRDDILGLDSDFHNSNNLDFLNFPKFTNMSDDYWLSYSGYSNQINTKFTSLPIKVLYGGFVFSKGDWVVEVEQDPFHYYTGEELALSIRSFTKGYDLFTPKQIVCFHRSHQKVPKKHINNNPKDIVNMYHRTAMDRLYKLINKQDIGKYGLGLDRSLEDYEKFAGISFKDKKIY